MRRKNRLLIEGVTNLVCIFQNQALPVDLRHRARQRRGGQPVVLATVQDGICMSPFGFSMFMGLGVALIAATIVIVSFKLRPSQKA